MLSRPANPSRLTHGEAWLLLGTGLASVGMFPLGIQQNLPMAGLVAGLFLLILTVGIVLLRHWSIRWRSISLCLLHGVGVLTLLTLAKQAQSAGLLGWRWYSFGIPTAQVLLPTAPRPFDVYAWHEYVPPEALHARVYWCDASGDPNIYALVQVRLDQLFPESGLTEAAALAAIDRLLPQYLPGISLGERFPVPGYEGHAADVAFRLPNGATGTARVVAGRIYGYGLIVWSFHDIDTARAQRFFDSFTLPAE